MRYRGGAGDRSGRYRRLRRRELQADRPGGRERRRATAPRCARRTARKSIRQSRRSREGRAVADPCKSSGARSRGADALPDDLRRSARRRANWACATAAFVARSRDGQDGIHRRTRLPVPMAFRCGARSGGAASYEDLAGSKKRAECLAHADQHSRLVAHEDTPGRPTLGKRNDSAGAKVGRSTQIENDSGERNDVLRSDQGAFRFPGDLFDRERFVKNEGARALANQRAHVRGDVYCRPKFVAQCANVGSLAACDAQSRRTGRLHAEQRQSIDSYRSRSTLDAFTFACQLVEPPALMVRGGVHGRNLRELSNEARERLAQETRPIRWNSALLDRLPGRILRRRRTAKHQGERVPFSLIFEQRDQSRGLSDRHGKDARRLRIERSEMAGGNLSIASVDRIDSAYPRDDAS